MKGQRNDIVNKKSVLTAKQEPHSICDADCKGQQCSLVISLEAVRSLKIRSFYPKVGSILWAPT